MSNGNDLLARVFAVATDEEQAAFLNEAGRALRLVCQREPAGEDLQLFRIADRLSEDGKRFIRKLGEMVGGR